MSVDTNVLLYASDGASPVHEAARGLLESLVQGPVVICLTWPTLMSYLRIATHPAVFTRPLGPEQASANVESLLAQPRVRAIGEDEGFWSSYRQATEGLMVRGKLVADAHVAAILLQHGVRTLYTRDADFRRFSFLDVVNPFAKG